MLFTLHWNRMVSMLILAPTPDSLVRVPRRVKIFHFLNNIDKSLDPRSVSEWLWCQLSSLQP